MQVLWQQYFHGDIDGYCTGDVANFIGDKMINRFTLRLIFTLCFFVFLVTANAYMRPVSAQTCDGVTNEQLVSDIYAKIKADKNLAPQISHINVVAVFAAVKLQGWANSKNDYNKVVDIVSETRCVRLVNVNLFEDSPPPTLRSGGACSAGTKKCGDICIPETDACNIVVEQP